MSPGGQPVIHIVDDDDAFRKATIRLVTAKGYQVAAYASAEEFLAAQVTGYGCILLDMRMPGLSGLQLQQQLAERPGCPPIIFVTGHGSIPMTVMAMKAGAEDFLSKTASAETLFAAITVALQRSAICLKEEAELAELRTNFAQLTPREIEVFQQVILGRLNKQIAFDLGTSERTIKAHRYQVMSKMGAKSVQQLVLMAQRIKPLTGFTAPPSPAPDPISL